MIQEEVRKTKISYIVANLKQKVETLEESKKVARVKIVLEGADEYRKSIHEIRTDMQGLNECIQELNNSMEQLDKSVKRFNKLFKAAENYPDESSISALQ